MYKRQGYKHYYGVNDEGIPPSDNLTHISGLEEGRGIIDSHDPIIVLRDTLGYFPADFAAAGTDLPIPQKNRPTDSCCDSISIVYGDFDKNDPLQPYKRYKITYYAAPITDGSGSRYAAFRSVRSWSQPLDTDVGAWVEDCPECYIGQKIRDHIVDMEFVPLDAEGRMLSPLPSPGSNTDARDNPVSYTHLTLPTKRIV